MDSTNRATRTNTTDDPAGHHHHGADGARLVHDDTWHEHPDPHHGANGHTHHGTARLHYHYPDAGHVYYAGHTLERPDDAAAGSG